VYLIIRELVEMSDRRAAEMHSCNSTKRKWSV